MPPAGYFTDDSMLRRVGREYAVALAGPRALLMQAAHPVAFAGFFALTGSLQDPYARLQRTANVLNAVGFGTREQADRATRRVRAVHRRIRGSLTEPAGRFPAGTPWAADDPPLLLWILATLVESNLLVYQRYVGPLTRDERQAYWDDFKIVGKLFALRKRDMPETIEDFEAYMEATIGSGDLFVSDEARELAVGIVMRPPLPPVMLPLRELINQTTVGLLPKEVRKLYGFRWDPARGVALRGGQEYVRRALLPVLPRRMRWVPSAAS